VLVYLVTILGISLLVVVHELGHYLFARAFGMKVLRFSIGFGPVLARYQPQGSPTVFQVCAIPFLAYVMIAGMNPTEEIDPDDPSLYPNKGVIARILTIFGGPFANYAAASILVFVTALFGWPEGSPSEPMIVETVSADSPAGKAGMKPGDIVLEAEGKKVRNVTDLIEITAPRAGKATSYVVEREGKRLPPMSITPKTVGDRGIIGVTSKTETVRRAMPVGEAAVAAIEFPWVLTVRNLEGIADLIKRRTTEDLTGPVGMVKIGAQFVERGFFDFLFILIVISVALGLFNLLPFPALDGGRLMFLGYEVITRRRANERIEAMVHAAGLLFLLGVIILVTWRDIAG
jgi:regulator of sigma E protease